MWASSGKGRERFRVRIFGLLVVVLLGGAAFAGKPRAGREPRRYALRELKFEGSVSETEQKLLEERIWSAIELIVSARGDEMIHAENVTSALAQNPSLKGCYEARCQLQLGDALKAHRVVTVQIRHTGPEGQKGDWLARISEFSVDGLREAGKAEVPCNNCSAGDLIGDVTRSVDPLFKVDAPVALCTLKVASTPPGATAIIDGTLVGETPFSHTIAAGKHAVAVEKSGFARGAAEVECAVGASEGANFALSERSSVIVREVPSDRRSPALKAVGAVLIVLGAAGVAGGGAALSVDGQGACDRPPGIDQCPQLYDTKLMGGVLVGVGAAALVGGVITLIVDGVRGERAPVALDVAPLSTGAVVKLQGGW